MTKHIAKEEHEVAYQELCQLVNRHAATLSAIELLAVAANMVGKLIALQDQRTTTPAMATAVVSANIVVGNRQAVEAMSQTKGTA